MKNHYVYYLQPQCIVVEANGKKDAKERAINGEGKEIESSFKLRPQEITNVAEVK